MKNKMFLVLALAFTLVGCTRTSEYVIPDNQGQIDILKQRADLNDQLDAARDALIAANTANDAALEARVTTLESTTAQLQADLATESSARDAADQAEAAARLAGDTQNASDLAAAISAQNTVNSSLQSQINTLNTRINQEKAARIAGDALLTLLLASESAARAAGDYHAQQQLNAEIAARQSADAQSAALIAQLQSDLAAETSARQAGDAATAALAASNLAAAVSAQQTVNSQLNSRINNLQGQITLASIAQSLINVGLQVQISHNSSVMSSLASSLSSLQSQVTNLSNSTSAALLALQNSVSTLSSSVSSLSSVVSGHTSSIADLYSLINGLQTQLNAEGTTVYKCSSDTENILKIGGKFYGAMNRVNTQQLTYVNGSTGSSQTLTTPALCKKTTGNNDAAFPTGTSCPNNYVLVPSQTITVPPGGTAQVTVVTSVEIAIEQLADGSYHTTGGGPACYFSIGNGGTTSTGLNLVN